MFSCSTLVVVALMATTGNLAGLPDYTPDANAERVSIPADYLWDLSVLFPDDEAWALALETTSSELDALGSGHGTLGRPDGLARHLIVGTIGRLVDPLGRCRNLQVAGLHVVAQEGRHDAIVADEAVGVAFHVGEAGNPFEAVLLAALGQGPAGEAVGRRRGAKHQGGSNRCEEPFHADQSRVLSVTVDSMTAK